MARVTTVAVGAVALTVALPLLAFAPSHGSTPREITIDARVAPRGEPYRGGYFLVRKQVLCIGGSAIPLDPPIQGIDYQIARHAAAGVIVESYGPDGVGGSDTLTLVATNGAQRVLATTLKPYRWLLDETRAHLVYAERDPDRAPDAVIVDLATGQEIARRENAQPFAFFKGQVWVETASADSTDKLGRWDVATDVMSPLPRRFRFTEAVWSAAAAAIGRVGDRKHVRVAPVTDDAGWDAWTAEGVFGWFSPSGRYVAVQHRRPVRDSSTIAIHDSYTGEVLRSLVGRISGYVFWESNRSLVLGGYNQGSARAYVRVTLGGRIERISGFEFPSYYRTPRLLLIRGQPPAVSTTPDPACA